MAPNPITPCNKKTEYNTINKIQLKIHPQRFAVQEQVFWNLLLQVSWLSCNIIWIYSKQVWFRPRKMKRNFENFLDIFWPGWKSVERAAVTRPRWVETWLAGVIPSLSLSSSSSWRLLKRSFLDKTAFEKYRWSTKDRCIEPNQIQANGELSLLVILSTLTQVTM